MSYMSWPPVRCLVCNGVVDDEHGGPSATVFGSVEYLFFLCGGCTRELDAFSPVAPEDWSLPFGAIPRFSRNMGDPCPEVIEWLKSKDRLAPYLVPEGYYKDKG